MEDFINSGVLIAVLLILSAIVSFIFIVIMRWVIAPFIYGTLVAMLALLSFATYFCITKYIKLKDNPNSISNSTTSFQFTTDVNYYLSLSITWLVIGIIAAVVLFIVLLLILVLMWI